MTTQETHTPSAAPPEPARKKGHRHWMMVACCVPMLVIAAIAVAAGAGIGFLAVALMCTLMMVLMMGAMGGMSHGGHKR